MRRRRPSSHVCAVALRSGDDARCEAARKSTRPTPRLIGGTPTRADYRASIGAMTSLVKSTTRTAVDDTGLVGNSRARKVHETDVSTGVAASWMTRRLNTLRPRVPRPSEPRNWPKSAKLSCPAAAASNARYCLALLLFVAGGPLKSKRKEDTMREQPRADAVRGRSRERAIHDHRFQPKTRGHNGLMGGGGRGGGWGGGRGGTIERGGMGGGGGGGGVSIKKEE
jgi:hypothetical protein